MSKLILVSDFKAESALLKIATHDGIFHADDTMAVAIVLLAHGASMELCRTRDMSIIDSADVVIDVGGVYDAPGSRFDHHQERGGISSSRFGFSGCAAAGLVWDRYGIFAVENHLEDLSCLLGGLDVHDAVREVYTSLIQEIDLMDTGAKRSGAGESSVSRVLGGFNPAFGEGYDPAFLVAVETATAILGNTISHAAAKLRDEAEAQVSFTNAEDGYSVFDRYLAGWQDKCPANIERVVFPRLCGGYTVQRPEGRKDLPGDAGEVLGKELIFVHKAGFIGACHTLEGGLQLAKL